jgi:hypothetical protein
MGYGAPHACAKDATHTYREKSLSGMMQLWPLHLCINFIHKPQQVYTTTSNIVDFRNGLDTLSSLTSASLVGKMETLTVYTFGCRQGYTLTSTLLTIEMNTTARP